MTLNLYVTGNFNNRPTQQGIIVMWKKEKNIFKQKKFKKIWHELLFIAFTLITLNRFLVHPQLYLQQRPVTCKFPLRKMVPHVI